MFIVIILVTGRYEEVKCPTTIFSVKMRFAQTRVSKQASHTDWP